MKKQTSGNMTGALNYIIAVIESIKKEREDHAEKEAEHGKS